MARASLINTIKALEESSREEGFINRINPVSKLLVTLTYIIALSSFDRYRFTEMLPMLAYPAFVMYLTGSNAKSFVKSIFILSVFILPVGMLNPVFDTKTVTIFGTQISAGWLTFATIYLKGLLTLTSTFLLVASSGISGITAALYTLRLPKTFVFIVILTYRYIWTFMDEVASVLRAYKLRAPHSKGIHFNAWGSLLGGILLRSLDKAGRVYEAMLLRGFEGGYSTALLKKTTATDYAYFCLWTAFFAVILLGGGG